MLAFERLGSGPPLLLVHGIGHRRQAWYPVRDQLAAGDPAELLWIVHEEPVLARAVGGKHGHESPVVV